MTPDDVFNCYAQWTENAPTTASYTVKHLLQNITDDNYAPAYKTETKTGNVGDMTAAEASSIPGFSAMPFDQVKITDDGKAVV